jgi:ankyrin repeat protein
MRYLILFAVIFFGTSLKNSCSAKEFYGINSPEFINSIQTPFNFFNTIPAKIKITDKVDLSFSVNNAIVSQYRYRLEVPDMVRSSVNKTFLTWSAWINNAFTDIIILKIEQEGRYKLVIEYKSYGTTEIRRYEKLFDVYDPATQVNTRATSRTGSGTGNKPPTPVNTTGKVDNQEAPDYNRLLNEAIERKDGALLREAVLNGAGINIKGLNGGNIYHLMNDNLANEDLISLLKAKDISIDQTDNFGNTPLHIAIMLREKKYVHSLISQGADMNIMNKAELSPLHLAAFLNDEEAANELLAKGAEIDLKGNTGYTPLHIAALMNNIEVAKDLLNMGASPKIKTDQNLTAEIIAKIQNYSLMKKFIAKGGSLNINQADASLAKNLNPMNSVKLSPQFDINLTYNKDLVKKRKLNRIAGFISVPFFAISTAGTIYFRSEANKYYSSYKNAETIEIAKNYYDKTMQYDTYTYISGGISIVSAFETVRSAIRNKSISDKMRKTLY